MKLIIQYTTQLKASVGINEETMEISNQVTRDEILQSVCDRHGDAFRKFAMHPEGGLLPSVMICIDNQQVDASQNFVLDRDCTLTFLSAISGG